jgi:hypothetical protein
MLLDCCISWQSWRSSSPRPSQRKAPYVNPPRSPPPLGCSELLVLGQRLPATNRPRLLWLLGQLLEHQLSAGAAQGEDGDESASAS